MAGHSDTTLSVAELFAGAGGFRKGLEKASSKSTGFKVIWSNQWEPTTKVQYASDIYIKRFGSKNHSNQDIAEVSIDDIPDHDLLVGGFPCQDYSVARTLNQASGLKGKKGVLWWEIHRILEEKGESRPKYLILENVDRLLKSPAKQRGRDFAVMIASLNGLGYAVEWRVINAADYGMPQRRRRVFILAYQEGTPAHASILAGSPLEWILSTGVIARAFPVKECVEGFPDNLPFGIEEDILEISDLFNVINDKTPFENSGISIAGKVYSVRTTPDYKGKKKTLGQVLEDEDAVPEEFFVKPEDIERWKYLKGAKKALRKTKSGHEYHYSEGPMAFPDPLDKPSRTIVTGEGGSTPSRFKHVIETKSGRLRRLTPVELERLNMFPKNHTAKTETRVVPDARRAFLMGNALVIGIVERLGKGLLEHILECNELQDTKRLLTL